VTATSSSSAATARARTGSCRPADSSRCRTLSRPLDLDALIGGFKPLFARWTRRRSTTSPRPSVTVFQGQGGTINDILDQTAQLTAHIAERDQAIGEVVKNLKIVLDTTVRQSWRSSTRPSTISRN